MDEKKFEEFCKALDAGETKFVENVGSREVGKVLFCSGRRLEVEVEGKRETWGIEFCQEKESP